jgi:hypothetical protein
MQSEFVGLSGVAKGNAHGTTLTVANEHICGQLGRGACLPIPPAALVEKNGVPYHVSLDFNLSGQGLPPADSAALVQALPELACGIVLFDVWIVNSDRHQSNLTFDQITGQVQLFDHSPAFLQGPDPINTLQAKYDELGIGGHCIAPQLKSLEGMRMWFERFNAIPNFFIEDAFETAKSVGLLDAQVPPARDFVLNRRARVLELVNAHRTSFPLVLPDEWDRLAAGGLT